MGSSLLVWSSFFHSPGSRLTPHHYNTYTICLAHLHLHLHAAVIIDLPSIIAYIHASCHHKPSRTYKHTQPKVFHFNLFLFFFFPSPTSYFYFSLFSRSCLDPRSVHPTPSTTLCCCLLSLAIVTNLFCCITTPSPYILLLLYSFSIIPSNIPLVLEPPVVQHYHCFPNFLTSLSIAFLSLPIYPLSPLPSTIHHPSILSLVLYHHISPGRCISSWILVLVSSTLFIFTHLNPPHLPFPRITFYFFFKLGFVGSSRSSFLFLPLVSRLSHHFLHPPTPFSRISPLVSLVSVSHHLSSSLSIGLYTCTIISYLRTVTISPHPKHSHHRILFNILSNILSSTHFTTLPYFFHPPFPHIVSSPTFTIPPSHHLIILFFKSPISIHIHSYSFFCIFIPIPPISGFISSRALVLNSVIPSSLW